MSGLCATASATTLVPGSPDDVDWLAREYGRYAGGACDAARALRRIDTGAWVGPAGDAFRTAIGEVPEKLERGQSSFARAATSLAGYARVLRDAQADAALAVRRYTDAEAATATWRGQVAAHDTARATQLAKASAAGTAPPPDTGRPSSYDPGGDDRTAAEHLLSSARDRVDVAARRTAAVLEDAREGAPHEPGLLSKAVHAVGSFVSGAAEATWGLAEFAYTMSPAYALIDPEGFVKNLEDLGKGVVYGIQHPKEFGKAMLDWDTWAEDPARALGHLVPDLVLAIATAGTGEAGVAAGRAMKGLDAAEDLTHGVRAASRAAGLADETAALLERRFRSPAEEVLEFQGRAPYKGQDRWSDRILQPGDTFSVGTPGEGRFAATPEAVQEVGTDARRYNEGLQVQSRKDPVDGVARYRDGLNSYEVKQPLPVGASRAQANPQFGAGGLPQYFLPDVVDTLIADGFVGEATTTRMTNLEAVIGPKGLSTSPLVPLARGTAVGGGTLVVSGVGRAGGCG